MPTTSLRKPCSDPVSLSFLFFFFPKLSNSPPLIPQGHTLPRYSVLVKDVCRSSNSETMVRFKLFTNPWRLWRPKSTHNSGWMSSLVYLLQIPCPLLWGISSLYLTSFALNLFFPGWGPKSLSMSELSAYLKTVNGLELPFLPIRKLFFTCRDKLTCWSGRTDSWSKSEFPIWWYLVLATLLYVFHAQWL